MHYASHKPVTSGYMVIYLSMRNRTKQSGVRNS